MVTLSNHRHSTASAIATSLVVAVVLAFGVGTAGAIGGPPLNQQRALEARAAELAQRRNAAEVRLEEVESQAAAQTGRLDELLERQQALQRGLNARAQGMYRGRRLDFVDVLTNSASFAEFATRMDLLTRMNIADAQALIELEATKVAVSRAGKELLDRQQQASAELRRIQAAENSARKELAASRAAYAEYQARVRTRVAAKSSAPAPRVSQGARPGTSGGGWKTGVASHYGKGSYGKHTADGTTIGPDSMIVAHKTLPFGTLVQFQYKGRTCLARVADRGPYTAGRMWDLGPGVIRVLDFNGVDTVRYRIVGR